MVASPLSKFPPPGALSAPRATKKRDPLYEFAARVTLKGMAEERTRPGFTHTLPGGTDAPPEVSPGLFRLSQRRLNRCMMLEYDVEQQRWKDALRRTPSRGVVAQARREERRREPRAPVAGAREPAVREEEPLHIPSVYDNPLWVGLLLAACPPLGVTLAWTSRTIPPQGKIALTVFGAFVMLVATGIAALIALS